MPQEYISVYYTAEDTLRAHEITAFLEQYGFQYRPLSEAATEAERGKWLRESRMLLAVTSPEAARARGAAEVMRQAFIKQLPIVCVSLEKNELDERFLTGDRPVFAVAWPASGLLGSSDMAGMVHRLAVRHLCRFAECFVPGSCEKDVYGRVIRHAVQAWQDNPAGQYALGDAYRHGRGVPARDTDAAVWLEKSAEQGYDRALIAAGEFRLDGRGVEKDEERAFRMFMRAARGTPSQAYSKKGWDPVVLGWHHVALCYSRGLGVVRDFETAARYFRLAADQGYAPAQYRLGLMYRDGVGVEASFEEATAYLERAMNNGEAAPERVARHYRCVSMRQMQQERVLPMLQRKEALRRGDCRGQWLLKDGHSHARSGRAYPKRWNWRRVGGYPEDDWLQTEAAEAYVVGEDERVVDVRTINRERGFSTWTWNVSMAAVPLGRLLERGEGGGCALRAIGCYRLAAEHQHSEGWRRLADAYHNGRGIPADAAQAARLYRRAAELGNERAMFALGVCFEQNVGGADLLEEQNRLSNTDMTAAEWAVEWYRRSATAGYAPAQNNLGGCYEDGFGVAYDPVLAVSWYTKAAAAQLPEACCRLGRCYQIGLGIGADAERALALYRTAADLGNPYAWYRLGLCYERGLGVPARRGQAADWYRRGAVQGVPEAQYAYALCLRAGHGVRRDEKAAYEWFRLAAEQDHIAASWEIGEYLLAGRLVLQDQGQAVEWLRRVVDGYRSRAFRAGEAADVLPELAITAATAAGRALYRMSCCVHYNEGIPSENPEEEALELIRQAARLEEPYAMTALADWYANVYRLGGTESDFACADGWYRRAMEAGQPDAAYRLGCLLARKDVFGNNPGAAREAATLFEAEAKRGHVEAMCRLAACCFVGRGVPVDFVSGFDWLLCAAESPVGGAVAQVMVSDCYRMGWGVSPDEAMATDYLLRAATAEMHTGRYPWMGERCPRWYAHWVAGEEKRAQTEAKFRLAVYGAGDGDAAKRFVYLCEAVLEGHAAAKDHLACLVAGGCEPQDYFPWLRLIPRPAELSLELGEPEEGKPIPSSATWVVTGEVSAQMRAAAMNHIGDGYFEGRLGLPCKPEVAVRCYEEAAAVPGQVWAQYSLGWCLLHGVGVAADPSEAVSWLTRAAVGHAMACYELATCYEQGIGVDVPNLRVALKYYRKALKLGDTRAQAKITEFEKRLKKQRGL